MSKQWIDFKKLRQELNFETVLSNYGVTLDIRETGKGRQHSGSCPLSKCKGKSLLRKVFSANLDDKIWQCFSCRQKGNVLDFIALMEGLDGSNGKDMRKAAEIAVEKFRGCESQELEPARVSEAKPPESSEKTYVKTVVNAPLDFALKSLDASHPWFKERG